MVFNCPFRESGVMCESNNVDCSRCGWSPEVEERRKARLHMENVPEWHLNPPEYQAPLCPICGDECETIYRDQFGEIVGCENCVTHGDAADELKEWD